MLTPDDTTLPRSPEMGCVHGTLHKKQDDIDFVGDDNKGGGNDPRDIPDSRRSAVVRYYEEGYFCGSLIAETALGPILDCPFRIVSFLRYLRSHPHFLFLLPIG